MIWLKRAVWVSAVIMLAVMFIAEIARWYIVLGFYVGLLWGWIIHMPGRELRTRILDSWQASIDRRAAELEQGIAAYWNQHGGPPRAF